MSRHFSGINASPGIEIGQAVVLTEENLSYEKKSISDIKKEKDRLNDALKVSEKQLLAIKDKVSKDMGEEEAEIFAAHLMLLEDPEFIPEVENKIETEAINAEAAVDETVNKFQKIFQNLDDDYLKERASDIQDVGNRILRNLLGEGSKKEELAENTILVARELTPSDTAQIDTDKVLAFITVKGGMTSHSAIMARSLEIPAVLGLNNIVNQVEKNNRVIVDGEEGKVITNPTEAEVEEYKKKKQELEARKEELAKIKGLAAETKDGHQVELAANIGTPDDIAGALDNGAEAVGLYRSEFLYMDRKSLPSEEEQFKAYKKAAEKIDGAVVIRTMDIGGDKELPYLDMPQEMNPFLGYRAIRMSLDKPEIFKVQLRAILRASAFGDVKIMYPMISNLEELRAANQILSEVRAELKEAEVSFDDELEVGMMIEVPAAAMISDLLAKETDFFSIGTNDLIQYTMATDRMNDNISHLYQPFHPAVLRLIAKVIKAAHKEDNWVGMCGEMAGDKRLTPFFLGVGLDEFSMSAISIPEVKDKIRQLTLTEAEEIAKEVLELSTAKEIKDYLESQNNSLEANY